MLLIKEFVVKKVFKTVFIFLLILLSCSKPDVQKVTFQIKTGDYFVTVSGQGELEAKNALVLTTPMVFPPPTLSYLISEGSYVTKDDIVAEFTATQIENDYINAQDEVEITKAEAENKEAELSLELLLYESQKHSAEASAQASRLQLAKIEFEPPRVQEIKRLQIEQFELDAERASKMLESLKKIQQEERANSEMRIRQAKNKLNRAKDQLDQLTLKAPHEGIVVHDINMMTGEKVKEGAEMYPRTPVVKLPDFSRMQVKMQIGETDAQKLNNGMPATITVPSVGTHEYSGKVTRIDRIAKPISRGSKVKKVEVIVELDSSNTVLKSGLTAYADIYVKKLKDMIAVPHECVFERDSTKIVYHQIDNKFFPLPILSLLQDEDFMVIFGDVKPGEELALREPSSSLVSWPDQLNKLEMPAWADTLKKAKEEPEQSPSIPPDVLEKMQQLPPGVVLGGN